jgi:hypothetical protein
VHREGQPVIVEPVDKWSESFLACLGAWDEEIELPEQELLEDLKDPFDWRPQT